MSVNPRITINTISNIKTKNTHFDGVRYYDPSLQRFLGEDPIGFGSGDFNFYGYVGSNPVNWIDPTGLSKHDPNSAYCQNLRKKMQNIQKDIKKRYDELAEDRLKLPKVKKGTKLYETIKGHEIIITELRRRYYNLADKYDDECGGGGKPDTQPSTCPTQLPDIKPNKNFSPWWMLPLLLPAAVLAA